MEEKAGEAGAQVKKGVVDAGEVVKEGATHAGESVKDAVALAAETVKQVGKSLGGKVIGAKEEVKELGSECCTCPECVCSKDCRIHSDGSKHEIPIVSVGECRCTHCCKSSDPEDELVLVPGGKIMEVPGTSTPAGSNLLYDL